MSLRRSEQKRSVGGPLKDISHHHLISIARVQNQTSASKVELSSYIEQNHHLRIKCAKIDEIESCANILMENIEKYKRWNLQLEVKVADLMKDNEKLRNQVQRGANIKLLKQENLRKQGQINGLKKKMEISDNLQLMRMQQQIVNQKQAKQRMISTLESKHKAELSKMEHQFKLNLSKVQHENQVKRSQVESMVKQNSILKSNLSEAEGQIRKMARQNDRIQSELMRSQDMMIQSQDQLNLVNEKYAELKLNTDQRISALTIELQRSRVEFQKSLLVQSILQRTNAQLKNQGAVLILENEDMQTRSLQLEQMNLIHLANIKNLQQRIASIAESNSLFEANMINKQLANRQILDDLQRDNLIQRKAIQELEVQILTKRKEIDDLIMIVSKMETDLKITTSAVTALEQTNARMIGQLKEKDDKLDLKTMEMSTLIAKISQLQTYQEKALSLLQSKQGFEKELINEKQKVIDLQNDLELERNRLQETQNLKARLTNQLQEKEQILKSQKDGKQRYQKMYKQQKAENILQKQRIAQLQRLTNQLQGKLRACQQLNVRFNAQFQFEKSVLIKDSMEQMEKLNSAKYDEIIKEYQLHYDQKIKSMEEEIKRLKDQISSVEQ